MSATTSLSPSINPPRCRRGSYCGRESARPNDRQVVAAAIAAGATVILAWNQELKKFGLRPETPDVSCPVSAMKPPTLMIAGERLPEPNKESNPASDLIEFPATRDLYNSRSGRANTLPICEWDDRSPDVIVTYRDPRTVLVDDGAGGEPHRDRRILTPVLANRAG